MPDIAWVKRLNGKMVILSGLPDYQRECVAVSVEGEAQTMKLTEWRKLPVWSGPSPIAKEGIRSPGESKRTLG